MSPDVAVTAGGPTIAQERRVRTAIPGPRSQEIHTRRTSSVSAGVASALPVYIAAAGGGVVVDVDGNSLIDMGSGIAVVNVGNAAPAVVANVRDQVGQFTHTSFMINPYESYVAVCEELNALTPGEHAKRSALFNSGAEAVENAVKIARSHTRRQAVVAFEHGYHGRTNLTMALTAKNMPYKNGFGPFAPEVYRMPLSYPFRDGLSGPQAAARAITKIDKEVGADNVAAIILEPITGEGGFVVPAEGFLPELCEYARAHGIVFIADEVQTGFCRTGDWFACENEGVVPDLITTAKGIAGGLPLAGVTGRAEMMDSVHPAGLGGTYGGSPVACAAALGAIAEMRTGGLAAAATQIGDVMLPRLRALAQRDARVGDVRGRGAMVAVEVVEPGTTRPDPKTTMAVAQACHRAGVVVLTAGTYGNVLRFLPPLVMPEHLLVEALDVIDGAFAAIG